MGGIYPPNQNLFSLQGLLLPQSEALLPAFVYCFTNSSKVSRVSKSIPFNVSLSIGRDT